MSFALNAVATLALLASLTGTSHAQERWEDAPEYACDGPCADARTLAGHTFVPSTLVEWPFVVSRVASTTSVGMAEVDISSQRLANRLGITGTGDFVYADQSILGSVAVTPWLSLGLRGQGTLIIPSDRGGAVYIGEQGNYGGSALAAVRVVRSHRFQVTALVDGGRHRPTSVVPARLPQSPLEEGELTTLRPGIGFAYAFSPRFGLQASASYAWQWLDLADEESFETLAAGAALTFDVQAVPLTLLVAGQYANDFGDSDAMDAMETMFGTGDQRVWGEAGIVYRGIRELDLGAAFDMRLNDATDDQRWFGQLRLAYYFL